MVVLVTDSEGSLSWISSSVGGVAEMVGEEAVGEGVGLFVVGAISPPLDASFSDGSLPWVNDWLRRVLVVLAEFMVDSSVGCELQILNESVLCKKK